MERKRPFYRSDQRQLLWPGATNFLFGNVGGLLVLFFGVGPRVGADAICSLATVVVQTEQSGFCERSKLDRPISGSGEFIGDHSQRDISHGGGLWTFSDCSLAGKKRRDRAISIHHD